MKVIKIKPQLMSLITREITVFSKKKVSSQIKSVDGLILFLKKNTSLRPALFDALNMMPVIGYINYLIFKMIKKQFSDLLLNWTYPQVRIDLNANRKFKSPSHVDKWILSPKKEGYIFWFPINKSGGNIIFYKNNNLNKIKKHPYWGLQSLTVNEEKPIFIKYGEGVLFDKNTLHNSTDNASQISIQLRYEILKDIKGFKRSVTQKSDIKVIDYWRKKYVNKK